ncbi:MAG: hypothetical protein ACF8TS_10430 [Maioricimonas sp. JB049]
MTPHKISTFQSRPWAVEALRLRITNNEAKVIDIRTPNLERLLHYARRYLNGAAGAPPDANQPT